MTEKEFKKIITDIDNISLNKQKVAELSNNVINKISNNLHQKVQIKESFVSSYMAFGINYNPDVIYIAVDVENINNNQLIFNAFENALILGEFTKIERTLNFIKFVDNEFTYVLELKVDDKAPVEYIKALVKKFDETSSKYTLLQNALKLVNFFEKEEEIKDLDYKVIINLLIKSLDGDIENKYYKYLSLLIKSLDDMSNNKKYVLSDVVSNVNLFETISEVKLNEYRKLRKALSKAVQTESEKTLIDSKLEVVIDVNPIFDSVNKTFSWSYELVGKDVKNSGGIYLNNEVEYQTAVLKGIFKGLKVIVDNNLTKKKIILKCDYDGILTDKMKSSDENKSRMKTINSLIEKNSLKVTCTK